MSTRTQMQKPTFFLNTVAGAAVLALVAACDSPTTPSLIPLATSQDRPDLTGTYTLTLSASSSCPLDLPESMRTRTYAATLAQAGGGLTVRLPSIFPPWDNRTFGVDNSFTGLFGQNNDVRFHLQFEQWFLPGPVTEFAAFGEMTATISPNGLSGRWGGYIRGLVNNEDGRGNRIVRCDAPDHGVVFSR